MLKWFVGAAALGLLGAVAMPGSADAAQRKAAVGVKSDGAVEVGSQYRGHRRAYHRPYRGYASPLYGPRYFAPRAIVSGYYPAWYTPYYDDYGYRSYGYGGYGAMAAMAAMATAAMATVTGRLSASVSQASASGSNRGQKIADRGRKRLATIDRVWC